MSSLRQQVNQPVQVKPDQWGPLVSDPEAKPALTSPWLGFDQAWGPLAVTEGRAITP